MTVKPGWEGRYFEDFEVGDVYQHPLGRTISEADNTWFTLLTCNTNMMHFNSHYAQRSGMRMPPWRPASWCCSSCARMSASRSKRGSP